jgi:hypothetical protein
MRKSDPTITNNVIPFPKRPKNRSSASDGLVTPIYWANCWISSLQVIVAVPAAVETNRGVAEGRIRFTNSWHFWRCLFKGNPTPELIDEMAPGLVRSILRRAGTGDTGKAELPKHLMRRLDLMCHFKHPAALIIQDWLDGNRGSCPPTLRQLPTIPPVHGSKSDEQDQQTRLQVFHCPPAARLSA